VDIAVPATPAVPKHKYRGKKMNRVLFAIGLFAALTLTATAQKNKKSPDAGDTDTSGKTAQRRSSPTGKKNGSGQADASPALSAVTNVQAQLQGTLDVRNAKVGDEVMLKTTQAVKQNGETVIPKGTALVGRVTEVTRRAKDDSGSRLGLVFDRLQGKDLSAPITASIISITNVAASASSPELFESDLSGSSRASGSASGKNSGGGGLLGGVGNTVGGVVNTATSTVGGVANTAVGTVGNTTSTLGNTVNGIQISNALSGSASGGTTLSAAGKNLRLEKGVMFQMSVANQQQ
jgi:hypothetical protein